MLKKNSLLILFSLLTFVSVQGQNEQAIERRQNFDFDWKFALGDSIGASAPKYNDAEWRSLNLPHDWSIEGRIAADNPTGNDGGYFTAGVAWYRKDFMVPHKWEGKHSTIYFEGVYMNSEVFVNGERVGFHPYGYTSFYYDISPYLHYGKMNTIAVKVDNSSQKNCRWYSGSGIYRHVWLTVADPLHVPQWGVTITTPQVSQEIATVKVKTLLANTTSQSQHIILSTIVSDMSLNEVARHTLAVDIEPHTNKEVTQELSVVHPKLWSPESPQLYKAHSQIKRPHELVDDVTHTFGIRSIAYSVDRGFVLNEVPLKMNGGCVHHDNGCLGAAAYDRAEERKVGLLKEAGYNAVRTSHNPPSEAFLDACDRLGLLVIDESFDGWRQQKTPHDYGEIFDEWWKEDVKSMIMRDINHPSIVMWSSGNEVLEREKPEAVEIARMLNSYIRELDPTRPVTSAMTSWNQGWARFDSLMAEHDVCGYNYYMHEAEADHERVPSRIIFQSESYPKDAFYNWNMVQTHNYIVGDYVWTAMDYLGESSIGRYYYPGEPDGQHFQRDFYPWHGAYCGDIDLTGWRKPISHYRNLLWNDTEKLYLAVREPSPENGKIKTTNWAVWPTWESWNWPGFEGKDIEVEVYSKYPKVRLYFNNELVGEKSTLITQEFKAVFVLPYAEGTLKAVGMLGEEEVESRILKTAQKAASIKLNADRQEIKADGQDLSFVTIEIVDEEGNLLPNAEIELTLGLLGDGTIIGSGNGNLKHANSYVDNIQKVWKGRAIVVIKSTKTVGDIKFKVTANGLPDSVLKINTISGF